MKKNIIQMSALFLFALALRLLFLGRAELWQDEMGFLNITQPGASVWKVFLDYWNHCISIAQLPLAGVLQNLWLHLAGAGAAESPFMLRMPAALLGALSVVGVFKLAELAAGRATAWAAALFMAVFFYPVYYSRELYCYAHVLCFSAFGLYFWLKCLTGISWKDRASAWAFLAALGLCHFAGSFLIVSAGAAAGMQWLWMLFVRKDGSRARAAFAAALVCAAAFLPVLPYWIRILTHENPHMASDSPLSPWAILNDGVCKLFFGERPVFALISWGFLLTGVITAAVRIRKEPLLIPLAGVMGLTAVLLVFATKSSQYISARYFSPVIAPAYLFFALGASGLCMRAVRSPKIAAGTAGLCCAVLLAVQAVLYLPPMYSLRTKSVDFGAIARWLNEQLEPGQPYLMESAYELRWVGGYYKTPGLTGASPYVHGGGEPEMDRLHAKQIEFMKQFPEAPFVESAHHGAGMPQGIWDWPHKNLRRHVRLANDPLRALIRRGIYPGEPGTVLNETDFHIDIYYNTAEDIAAAARELGDVAIFRWAGWNCVPYAQDPRTRVVEYGRMAPGALTMLQIDNLLETPVCGRIQLSLAVGAPSGAVDIYLRLPQSAQVTFRRSAGQFQTVETPEFELPPAGLNLEIGLSGARAASVQGILVRDAQFVTTEEQP